MSAIGKIHHCDWSELAALVPDGVDALITDPPYSERTHTSHAAGAQTANRASDWARKQSASAEPPSPERLALMRYALNASRRKLNYAHWTEADVAAFVAAWAPLTRGWIVALTDHVLAPAWTAALEAAGRYAFAPLACVEPGSRVRMLGDGPAQWSCWAVVARPRTPEFVKWGSLPGAYVVPGGFGERASARVVGGKPLWLMERLVEDYSRPGDLVCDPCCGAGTTLRAAERTGRRWIGSDAMAEHAELARAEMDRPQQRPLFAGAP